MSTSTDTATTGSGATPATAADLRPIDLFDELDDETLTRWARTASIHTAARGERYGLYARYSW